MSIPKTEIKKFSKMVVEEFLSDKNAADLQGITQDHIDAFVIPVMTEVEDIINTGIADKIRAAYDTEPLGESDEWWSSRR